MYLEREIVGQQFASFYSCQFAIALAHFIPHGQLTVEEAHQSRLLHPVVQSLVHPLACFQFHGAQTIFIEIVGVDFIYR